MLRKILLSCVLVLVSLVIGLGVFVVLVVTRPTPPQRHVESRAPIVATVELMPQRVRDVLRGYGTALADKRATLTAEVNAPVLERVNNIDVGDRVAEGDVLIRLDDRQYVQELHEAESRMASLEAQIGQLGVQLQNQRSLLEIAESDLTLTREEYERVEGLFAKGAAPKTERDSTRLRYQVALRAKQQIDNQIALIEPQKLELQAMRAGAEAAAERAQLNIERCQIKAPFEGQIESININVGDRVQMGTPMLEMLNLDRIVIPVELPVSTRAQSRVGARVELYVESMPKVHWEGEVARIAPSADMLNRTYRVYVEVNNRKQDMPLLPGYFVKAAVEGELLTAALMIPRHAVVDGMVFVANGHKAHAREVEVLRYIEDDAVLAGNVKPGDQIITSNLDVIFDDAPVRLEGEPDTVAVDPDVSSDGLAMDGEGDR
ncbi:MAG TPA: efflux RND transporter periplasmic adaptor subunit [Phycisphaerae bacterium]|nr:efflux RND transporter periplasmic adaptor subunit [Phycisphaerae bacterium]